MHRDHEAPLNETRQLNDTKSITKPGGGGGGGLLHVDRIPQGPEASLRKTIKPTGFWPQTLPGLQLVAVFCCSNDVLLRLQRELCLLVDAPT